MSNSLCVEFLIHDKEKFKFINDLIFDAMNKSIDGKGEELGYEVVAVSLEPELSKLEEDEDIWEEF